MTHPIDAIRSVLTAAEIDEESFARAREKISDAPAVVPDTGYSFTWSAALRPVQEAIDRLGEDRAREEMQRDLMGVLRSAYRPWRAMRLLNGVDGAGEYVLEVQHDEVNMSPERQREHRREAARERANWRRWRAAMDPLYSGPQFREIQDG